MVVGVRSSEECRSLSVVVLAGAHAIYHMRGAGSVCVAGRRFLLCAVFTGVTVINHVITVTVVVVGC